MIGIDEESLGRVEALMYEVKEYAEELEVQLADVKERGDEAERLLTECWWAFYDADPVSAQLFRMREEKGMAMFL